MDVTVPTFAHFGNIHLPHGTVKILVDLQQRRVKRACHWRLLFCDVLNNVAGTVSLCNANQQASASDDYMLRNGKRGAFAPLDTTDDDLKFVRPTTLLIDLQQGSRQQSPSKCFSSRRERHTKGSTCSETAVATLMHEAFRCCENCLDSGYSPRRMFINEKVAAVYY